MLGTAAVVQADPDGYSILTHSSALTIAPAVFGNLSYDAARDLSSVLTLGSAANVVIVPMSRPWKTAKGFVAAAKIKDASITFGSVGIGSAVHRQISRRGDEVLNSPKMQRSLRQLGVEATPMTPREMDDLVVRETAANLMLIKAAGIK